MQNRGKVPNVMDGVCEKESWYLSANYELQDNRLYLNKLTLKDYKKAMPKLSNFVLKILELCNLNTSNKIITYHDG